jgi:5-methyltetrahydrofolate corrinoid/iron sulfur protein methyltransferase
MEAIGERINGMFKAIGKAIKESDASVIEDMAKRQEEAGADILDLNVGPAAEDRLAAMRWLVETVQNVSGLPLAIDSTNPDVVRAGLEACENPAVINSTTGEQEKLNAMMPMAAEHGCSIIGLTIDEEGVPGTAAGRMEVALKLVSSAMEHGLPTDRLYVDAVILPVNALQDTPPRVLEVISQVPMLADPAPKTVLGLSNVSQGAQLRPLLNRTYLVMCLGRGLDAAIVDVLDEELMDAMITAEVLMNRAVYADDFLKAYRK